MTFTQRVATVEDAQCVAGVLLSSREAFLPYAPLPHTDAKVRQWVRETLIPAGDVTVACDAGAIVGVLATNIESNVGWIEQLYVEPSSVGRGIGSFLLAHALASLPRPVRLYTFQANVRARSFYERYGFRAIALSDGSSNEERCPDVLYELSAATCAGA